MPCVAFGCSEELGWDEVASLLELRCRAESGTLRVFRGEKLSSGFSIMGEIIPRRFQDPMSESSVTVSGIDGGW